MKILHITSELDGGGIERLLYNYSLFISKDFIFDYAICSDTKGILEDKVTERGSAIYHYPKIRTGIIRTVRVLKRIIREGNYDIVQVHADYRSCVALFAAFLAGAKIRIAHSHTFNEPETKITRFKRRIITQITKFFATALFACGSDAGEWTWGTAYAKSRVYLMHNAISYKEYAFNYEQRELLRNELGVKNAFVVGSIGRLCYQKNQEFLLPVIHDVVKKRDDVVFFFIGGGEDEEKLKSFMAEHDLNHKVFFLGVRKDVNKLLDVLDLFVLPSKYEGLPVTLVEAQANGVPALISDTVTKEVLINDNVRYIPLETNLWIKEILHASVLRCNLCEEAFKKTGYEISAEAQRLQEYYDLLKCQKER
jgi:glycosyltransferase involved in cell wall biosynthesis